MNINTHTHSSEKERTLIICSGGLDSVILAHKVKQEKKLIAIASFNYSQLHSKELEFAKQCAQDLDVPHEIIDISAFGALLNGSALINQAQGTEVPDGHYAQDNMSLTVVPNRNAIMLTMAYALAATWKAKYVGAAFHGGDHFIYPDCRPGFARAFDTMQKHALEGMADIDLYVPYIEKDKAEIVKEGAFYNVPFEKTWSCYKGKEIHCGKCGTCVERQEAFYLAGIPDPTLYEDNKYWKQVCNV